MNESGRTTSIPSLKESSRRVSIGNGSSAASAILVNLKLARLVLHSRCISHIRSLCLSASTMLSTGTNSHLNLSDLNTISRLPSMIIGRFGHETSISLVIDVNVQRSRRFRRCADEEMTIFHLLHTFASVFQASTMLVSTT